MPVFEGHYAGEVLQSASQCAEYTGEHLQCLYSNACSMKNKQEDLEALAQSQNYYTIDVNEILLDESCDWCAMMDGWMVMGPSRGIRRADKAGAWPCM